MRIAGAVLLVLSAAAPAMAQTAPEPQQAGDALDAGGEPTLSINAHIEAKSITIRQRGKAQVHIWANPGGEGSWKLDRHGIPNPIPVGKTFHDVALDLDGHANIDEHGLTVGGSAAPGKAGPAPDGAPPQQPDRQ